MPDTPLFDLIIPTYNNADELIACLDSLRDQSLSNFKVIVCIDGSTDDTREQLKHASFPFELVIVEQPDGKNHGRNAARNLALHYITAPYLCFLDSDLLTSTHFLRHHFELLRKYSCISVGFIEYSDLKNNLWAQYLETRGRGKYPHESAIPFNYMVTGNCAMPAKWFIEAGGQDPTMRRYGGGDTELAFRLWKLIRPEVRANHKAVAYAGSEKSLDQALVDMSRFGRENLPYLVQKHPESRFLYYFEHVTAPELKGMLLRMTLCSNALRLRKCLSRLPKPFQFALINYLVLVAVYAGYYKRFPEDQF